MPSRIAPLHAINSLSYDLAFLCKPVKCTQFNRSSFLSNCQEKLQITVSGVEVVLVKKTKIKNNKNINHRKWYSGNVCCAVLRFICTPSVREPAREVGSISHGSEGGHQYSCLV